MSAARAHWHGGWRGAAIGAAWASALYAQRWAGNFAHTHSPAPVAPFAGTAAMLATGTVVAAAGTLAAAAAYMLLWRRHRRGSWTRREGHLVLLCGAASWAGMWALNAAWRAQNLTDALDGDWAALAQPPPLLAAAAVPVAVHAVTFSRAARRYHQQVRRQHGHHEAGRGEQAVS